MGKRKFKVQPVNDEPKPKRRSGYTLPGYNYLGPGNDLHNGPPTALSDQVAREHDFEYTDIVNQGNDPYWNWNGDDQTAINEFGYDYGGVLGKLSFNAKKAAKATGILGETRRHPYSFNHQKKRHFLKHIKAHESDHMSGYTNKENSLSEKTVNSKVAPIQNKVKPMDIVKGYSDREKQAKKAYDDAMENIKKNPMDPKAFLQMQAAKKTYEETKNKGGEIEQKSPAGAPTTTPETAGGTPGH